MNNYAPTNIEDVIAGMKHLMYGYNYEVCLGIDIFDGTTELDFRKQVKEKYPNTHPELYPLVASDLNEFLDDIKEKMDYRGDSTAGLALTESKEKELRGLQNQYFDFLNQFNNEQTKYFHFPDPDGIPGYPVFWDFCYALFSGDKIILLYGSASD